MILYEICFTLWFLPLKLTGDGSTSGDTINKKSTDSQVDPRNKDLLKTD